MDVIVDYCGTAPLFQSVYIVPVEGCPCGALVYSSHYGFYDCMDGNASMKFFSLPSGTYYIPIYTDIGVTGPYTINVK